MADHVYDGPPTAGEKERALVEVADDRDRYRKAYEELDAAVRKTGLRADSVTQLRITRKRIAKELQEGAN